MYFSKVALLSALAHGFGMNLQRSHNKSIIALPDFNGSPSKPKQNKLSQKKRRLIKRRLNKK